MRIKTLPICYKQIPIGVLLLFILPILSWSQETHNWNKVFVEDGQGADNFGKSVSILGNYAIVGAWTADEKGPESGAAYIYKKNQETEDWQLVQKIMASDGAPFHNFGTAVLLHEEYAVVSAQGHDQFAGAVYLFRQENGEWKEFKKIMARDRTKSDFFGTSLAMSKGRLIVGAYGDDNWGNASGAVYIFEQNEGGPNSWEQSAKLTAGQEGHRDHFGISVATDGTAVIVGADGDNKRGSFYVFAQESGQWTRQLQVFASDGNRNDRFAHSLAISGDYIVAGADQCDDQTGAVYIFERNLGGPNNWGEALKINSEDGWAGDRFGKQVALEGPFLIVGSEGSQAKQGAAYVYKYDQEKGQWNPFDKLIAFDGLPNDLFGSSVAVHNKQVMVGAFQATGANRGAGGMYLVKLEDKSDLAAKEGEEIRRE